MAKPKYNLPGIDPAWQAQSDLRCLVDANAIRNDAKRMAAVKKVAGERLADIDKEEAAIQTLTGVTEKDK